MNDPSQVTKIEEVSVLRPFKISKKVTLPLHIAIFFKYIVWIFAPKLALIILYSQIHVFGVKFNHLNFHTKFFFIDSLP